MAVNLTYELLLFAPRATTPFFRFAPAGQPYGAFSAGDIFMYGNRPLSIERVAHGIIQRDQQNALHQTSLVLAERRPDDHPVPWPW